MMISGPHKADTGLARSRAARCVRLKRKEQVL